MAHHVMAKSATPRISEAIRKAAEREGLGIESFREKYAIPNDFFYRLLRDEEPLPPKTRRPLRRLKAAGVKHPLLDLVA